MIEEKERSPKWSTTTKLVVALTLAAILIALFIQFRNIVGPLLMAFLLAYLIHPVASRLNGRIRLPWRLSVTVLYLLLVVVILGLLTWGGFALFEQVQSLFGFIERTVNNLPAQIEDISHQSYQIGPFVLDFSRIDLQELYNQIIGVVQTLVARVGTLITTIASSTATTLGWFLFTLLVSYFILAETKASSQIIYLQIPGYEEDTALLGKEVGRIWNAFVRGQFLIILLTIFLYTVLLGLLGVKYYFGLAILAGLARFFPYIGPAVAWTTYGLVCYLQGTTIFGLQPFTYAMLVIGIALVTDNIIDSFVTPRMMADALSVHPAAVMVAALVGANLLGFVGVILAAPVFASFKLVFTYLIAKLTDTDPWEKIRTVSPQPITPLISAFRRLTEPVVGWYRSKFNSQENRNPPFGSGK